VKRLASAVVALAMAACSLAARHLGSRLKPPEAKVAIVVFRDRRIQRPAMLDCARM